MHMSYIHNKKIYNMKTKVLIAIALIIMFAIDFAPIEANAHPHGNRGRRCGPPTTSNYNQGHRCNNRCNHHRPHWRRPHWRRPRISVHF